MKIIISLILLISIPSFSYEVNLYDSPTYKNKVIIEIIDDCDKTHKLELNKTDLGTSKTLKWLKNLVDKKIINNC